MNRNCWLVKLKPGGENGNKKEIEELQNICIEQGFFGMGWCVQGMYDENSKKQEEISIKDNKKIIEYEEKCKKEKWNEKIHERTNLTARQEAFRYYQEIESGDYVMTRTGDGKYYIGIADGNAFYYNGDEQIIRKNLGWCGKIKDKWIEIKEEELPGHVYGYFSYKNQSTIRKVSDNNTDAKDLIENTYKYKTKEHFEKKKISVNDFNKSLFYTELEDLAYCYILNQKENKGYILYPSRSKINTVKYEFFLINVKDENRKMITCQVKNSEEVLYKNYFDDAKEYEKIYLFSGKEQYIDKNENAKLSKEFIEELKNKGIYIIDKEKLYNFLKYNKNSLLDILRKRIGIYYEFE